jgi:leader peptidase (prepilin peptidase)/N-methyltransferase
MAGPGRTDAEQVDSLTALTVVGSALIGLVVGSFLNVVIHRVPRGDSVVRPRSHCPACGSGIRPRDEVPVLSWVLLRGRCRDCGTGISVRYPLVELLTAVVFVALALKFGPSSTLPAYLYLGAICVALALIDLDTKRLPDAITLPSYPIGILLLGLSAFGDAGWSPLFRGLIGLAAMYAFYFVLRFAYPRGMGFGDVKLAGVLGLYTGFLGWGAWAVALFGGFLFGGIVSIGLVIAGRAGRKSKVPYGPFMVLGALVAVFAGQPLANAYLDFTVR